MEIAPVSLLIVVDMQAGFVTEPTRHLTGVVKNLARQWVAAGRPLVLSRYHNHPGSQFEKLLRWYKLRDEADTALIPEFDELLPSAVVIDKTGYTVFTPELDKLIEAREVTDVVLCGVDAETCVLKSAADAFERGLTPWIVADACASNGGPAWHKRAMELAERYIGPWQVIDSETVLQKLNP